MRKVSNVTYLHLLPADFRVDFKVLLLKHSLVWLRQTFVSFCAHVYLHPTSDPATELCLQSPDLDLKLKAIVHLLSALPNPGTTFLFKFMSVTSFKSLLKTHFYKLAFLH